MGRKCSRDEREREIRSPPPKKQALSEPWPQLLHESTNSSSRIRTKHVELSPYDSFQIVPAGNVHDKRPINMSLRINLLR